MTNTITILGHGSEILAKLTVDDGEPFTFIAKRASTVERVTIDGNMDLDLPSLPLILLRGESIHISWHPVWREMQRMGRHDA